ncbi:MAG TPA: hypothetical protein VFY29_21600 [Terriglobia bacterium]|nr:hypothetical protein [Terriglobia bacterium]
MQQLAKRAVLAILGVVVMLAYWTFTGRGSNNGPTAAGIPAKVHDGGGGLLAINVDSTSAARFSISFSDDNKSEEFWTPVPAGPHTWVIDVPKGSGGYIELDAENPKVGDKLSWKISLDGKIVDEQSDTLDQPLPNGYAFFLQSDYEDYSAISAED